MPNYFTQFSLQLHFIDEVWKTLNISSKVMQLEKNRVRIFVKVYMTIYLYPSFILCETKMLLIIFQGLWVDIWFSVLHCTHLFRGKIRLYLCVLPFVSLMVGPLDLAHFASRKEWPWSEGNNHHMQVAVMLSPPGVLSPFCLHLSQRWSHLVPQLQNTALVVVKSQIHIPSPDISTWMLNRYYTWHIQSLTLDISPSISSSSYCVPVSGVTYPLAEAPNLRIAPDSPLSQSVQKVLLTSLVEYILILFTPLYHHNHDPNTKLPRLLCNDRSEWTSIL